MHLMHIKVLSEGWSREAGVINDNNELATISDYYHMLASQYIFERRHAQIRSEEVL